MVKVYKHAHVQEIQQFYGELLAGYSKWTVKEHLQLLSERLLEGYRAQQTLVTREINNYHPAWLGRPADEILNAGLDRSDMRQVIASEYGFASWEKVWSVDRRYDPNFEEALDHLLNGDEENLKEILASFPELAQQRSVYDHGATLLHYVGSNGVELWRQQVPMNLADLTQILLHAGVL